PWVVGSLDNYGLLSGRFPQGPQRCARWVRHEHHGDWNLRRYASMDSHRRHHSGVFLVRCVSRRSTAPADRRRLVPHKRAPGKDVCLSALQKRELRHQRALGRLRHAETSCELNTIKRQGAAWLASFGCSGAWLSWLEDDEIRVSKDGWTLEAKIKNT